MTYKGVIIKVSNSLFGVRMILSVSHMCIIFAQVEKKTTLVNSLSNDVQYLCTFPLKFTLNAECQSRRRSMIVKTKYDVCSTTEIEVHVPNLQYQCGHHRYCVHEAKRTLRFLDRLRQSFPLVEDNLQLLRLLRVLRLLIRPSYQS